MESGLDSHRDSYFIELNGEQSEARIQSKMDGFAQRKTGPFLAILILTFILIFRFFDDQIFITCLYYYSYNLTVNVILCGVHLNMCVLGRPFGIRQMVKLGKKPT